MISLKFVPNGPINNITALVQYYYLSQWWLLHWCIYASLGLNELILYTLSCLKETWKCDNILYHFLTLQWQSLLKISCRRIQGLASHILPIPVVADTLRTQRAGISTTTIFIHGTLRNKFQENSFNNVMGVGLQCVDPSVYCISVWGRVPPYIKIESELCYVYRIQRTHLSYFQIKKIYHVNICSTYFTVLKIPHIFCQPILFDFNYFLNFQNF